MRQARGQPDSLALLGIKGYGSDRGSPKSLAKELAGKGDITVNAISPAVIRTEMLDGIAPDTVKYMISKIPMGRTGTIDEVAALVHYLVSPGGEFHEPDSATISAAAGPLIDDAIPIVMITMEIDAWLPGTLSIQFPSDARRNRDGEVFCGSNWMAT